MVVGGMLRNGIETNLGKIGSLDFLVGIAHDAKAHLHIGLPAAQPDISDQYVMQLDRLMPFNRNCVGTANTGRMNLHFPAAVGSGNARCMLAANFYLDLVAGF